ncbi:MAG TPA: Rpn family recombination-promoting nuclease/putative transposase [Blastocatellia bacterium]|nr:Rpn family recombination-promoting nuclease/putative transposase [Blastocatellia bacterium]HMY73935.1 Rpn family recombination-promoting nuclease/putative transposase [Blastocatellia bacterium]HMZ20683.1 Rpn family recombination-promoting nuclease/putative transposase [Blastocatellia bacterium]HNG34500.1 Rpn family recombination-promoting nuclease/putative transposase [Blastocatellia bacterium]
MAVTEKYLDPFTDFGFKKLFGSEPNKDLLIDFLNQLLPPQHQIQDLSFARNEQMGRTAFDRRAIFDLFCTSPSGEHFIVEMQRERQKYFKDRSVFYATFPIQEQAQQGDWNYQLTPVYLVAILDFVFDEDKDDPQVCHRVQLKDQRQRVFYDKLMFIYLEMPKFKKTEAELETPFDKWLYVLRHLPKLTERPARLQERVFAHLFETAEVGKFNRDELVQYEESLKVARDNKNVMETAVEEAEERGEARGLAKGEEIGLAKGELKKAQAMARKALLKNLPLSDIADLTGLSEEEISALRP